MNSTKPNTFNTPIEFRSAIESKFGPDDIIITPIESKFGPDDIIITPIEFKFGPDDINEFFRMANGFDSAEGTYDNEPNKIKSINTKPPKEHYHRWLTKEEAIAKHEYDGPFGGLASKKLNGKKMITLSVTETEYNTIMNRRSKI